MDAYLGFDEFVVARTAALSRVAYLLTGDHHLAQDLLQVALSRLASRWPEVGHGRPDAYVRKTLVNEMISWRRRRRYHEQPTEPRDDVPTATDLATSVVRRVVVGRALAQLTPRQRAVLVLRYFEDLSEVETAEILGCSVGTVKSQTHYAIVRLRAVAPELAELVREPSSDQTDEVLA